MAVGPGIYDALCTRVREETGGKAVILIVSGGRLGSGFSVQSEEDITARLPRVLRDVADAIEQDLEELTQGSH